jgi:hypothetical protein
VLLACDVSGSCSASCDETLAAAVAVAEVLAHVLVLRHSNGQVLDALGGPVRRSGLSRGDGELPRIIEVVRAIGRPVAGIIAWGDMDAGDDYRALCEGGAVLYLLDSYCARHGARPASRNLRGVAESWRRQPAGWWQGVNNAASAAQALMEMARCAVH